MSSSEEEDLVEQRIRESVSEELIFHMKKGNNDKRPVTLKKKLNPSLREGSDKAEQFQLTSTPEFRDHVAKKLSSYLDGIIDIQNEALGPQQNGESSDIGGIKLLNASKSEIHDACDEKILGFKSKRSRKKSSSTDGSSDENERQKLASVMVTGDSILSSGEGAFQKQTISKSTNIKNVSHEPKSSDEVDNVSWKKKRNKLKSIT